MLVRPYFGNQLRKIEVREDSQVCMTVLLLANNNEASVLMQSYRRRFGRSVGWFTSVWSTYSEKRFKDTFRISRSTFFMFLLGRILNAVEKGTFTEEPISPEARLAILCLYRLVRGDYYSSGNVRPGVAFCRSLSHVSEYVTPLSAVHPSTSSFSPNTEHLLLSIGNSHLQDLYLVSMKQE